MLFAKWCCKPSDGEGLRLPKSLVPYAEVQFQTSSLVATVFTFLPITTFIGRDRSNSEDVAKYRGRWTRIEYAHLVGAEHLNAALQKKRSQFTCALCLAARSWSTMDYADGGALIFMGTSLVIFEMNAHAKHGSYSPLIDRFKRLVTPDSSGDHPREQLL